MTTLFESYSLQVIGVESVQVLSRQIVMVSGVLDEETESSNVEAKTTVKSNKRLMYEIAFIAWYSYINICVDFSVR